MSAKLSLMAAKELGTRVLRTAGVPEVTAALVARALVAAEADGIPGHGLSRLLIYSGEIRAGTLAVAAEPVLTETAPGTLSIDARNGFSYPAIAAGLERAIAMVKTAGTVSIGIGESNHSGVLGHHVEHLAEAGLVALAFASTPAFTAPWGGTKPLLGTNPVAFACPVAGRAPLVVDLSLSKVARGRIITAAAKGEAIPEDWALDGAGNPTTDAKAALSGTLLPMGDAKGAALAIMVEILAAALTGSNFASEISLVPGRTEPLRLAQFLIVIDPGRFAGGASFADRVGALRSSILAQPGTRLPGDRRLIARRAAQQSGISIPDELHAELVRLAAS